MELKVEDFIKIRNLIYEKAGIFFETKKIYFVSKRLENRLTTLKIDDFSQYYNLLKYEDRSGEELQNFINLLTTNETYFFRESAQLDVFLRYCLPEIAELKKQRGQNQIRIWSAGCSSGEEPYTIAIMLVEHFKRLSEFNIEITATDIDTNILQQAKSGEYNERSLKDVAPDIINKYFSRNSNGLFKLSDRIKQMVRFGHLNLFDHQKMRLIRNIDFIFCRNVLIYFDDFSRKEVVANFYDSLNPGGYIYLGHAESVSRINTAFQIKKLNDFIVHQKPLI